MSNFYFLIKIWDIYIRAKEKCIIKVQGEFSTLRVHGKSENVFATYLTLSSNFIPPLFDSITAPRYLANDSKLANFFLWPKFNIGRTHVQFYPFFRATGGIFPQCPSSTNIARHVYTAAKIRYLEVRVCFSQSGTFNVNLETVKRQLVGKSKHRRLFRTSRMPDGIPASGKSTVFRIIRSSRHSWVSRLRRGKCNRPFPGMTF